MIKVNSEKIVMSASQNLKNLWVIRFESKHSDLKTVTKAITCRKNLCYSIIMREQLKAYYMNQNQRGLLSKTSEINT